MDAVQENGEPSAPRRGSHHVVMAIVLLIVFGGPVACWIALRQPSTPAATAGKIEALTMAETFVRDHLKAPKNAAFAGIDGTRIEETSLNNFRVRGWVDSENGFGAMIRANYECDVRYHADTGGWTASGIKITER